MNRGATGSVPLGTTCAADAGGGETTPATASSGAPTPESTRISSQTAATAPAQERGRERGAVGATSLARRRNVVTSGIGRRSTPYVDNTWAWMADAGSCPSPCERQWRSQSGISEVPPATVTGSTIDPSWRHGEHTSRSREGYAYRDRAPCACSTIVPHVEIVPITPMPRAKTPAPARSSMELDE